MDTFRGAWKKSPIDFGRCQKQNKRRKNNHEKIKFCIFNVDRSGNGDRVPFRFRQ